MVGAKLGSGLGIMVGTVVVGAALGDPLGIGEGALLGVDEGPPVGSVDGTTVGILVEGAAVGAEDGVALGVPGLGTSVGSLKLGVLVGSDMVGDTVGATVGGQMTVPHSCGHMRATTETTVLRSPSAAQSASEKEGQNSAFVTTRAQLSALGADVGTGSVGACVGCDESGAPVGSEIVEMWVGSKVVGDCVGASVIGAPVGSEVVGNSGSAVLGWSVCIVVGCAEVGEVRVTQSPHNAGHTARSGGSAHIAMLRQNPRSLLKHHI